jgi:hypothetical protein
MHDEVQRTAIELRERLKLPQWEIVAGEEFVVPHELLTKDIWDAIIIVAGGRNFNDDGVFTQCLEERLLRDDLVELPRIVFVSGQASKGADDMIISWCKENGFPYALFPADWDGLGRSAGYVRNSLMARVATHLIAYWDGDSRGTKHMIAEAHRFKLSVTINLVDPDPDWQERTRKTSWQETEQPQNRPFWNTSAS